MRRLEGHSENGPARRAAAHAQQHTGSDGRAGQAQRTAGDLDEATRTARLLDIVEERRRPVSGIDARPTSTLALQTDSRSNVDERGLKQGVSRERGARDDAVRVRTDLHP